MVREVSHTLCLFRGRDTVKPANSESNFWFFVTAVVSALCFDLTAGLPISETHTKN